jgi:hypothetical protein
MAETKLNQSSVFLYPRFKKRGADELLTEEDTDGTEIMLTEENEDIEGEDR